MGLMMLAAANGAEIRIVAKGRQAGKVLEALEALITDKFGERE
jgi:phosphocarrier protein